MPVLAARYQPPRPADMPPGPVLSHLRDTKAEASAVLGRLKSRQRRPKVRLRGLHGRVECPASNRVRSSPLSPHEDGGRPVKGGRRG
jgi:hypothetical protein